MKNAVGHAQILSRALHVAWDMLDGELKLPAMVVRQIDELRPASSSTLAVRDYFEAVCYETLLMRGVIWERMRRQSIPAIYRSRYLDWLVDQEFGLSGMHESPAVIADPAYWRWARLKYADAGTDDNATWSAFLAGAKRAALADCRRLSLATSETAASLRPLSPRQVRGAISEACARRQLDCNSVRYDSNGFGFRVPLAVADYYIECRVRDFAGLRRGIVPFEFEIASAAPQQSLRVAGDRSIWPGCAEYQNVCMSAEAIGGVGEVLALFLGAFVKAIALGGATAD